SSTGGASFDAESGSLAGLSNAGDRVLVQVCPQRLRQPNRGGAFALSERSGRHSHHDDILAQSGPIHLAGGRNRSHDLRLVSAVWFVIIRTETDLARQLVDWFAPVSTGNFDVAARRDSVY